MVREDESPNEGNCCGSALTVGAAMPAQMRQVISAVFIKSFIGRGPLRCNELLKRLESYVFSVYFDDL